MKATEAHIRSAVLTAVLSSMFVANIASAQSWPLHRELELGNPPRSLTIDGESNDGQVQLRARGPGGSDVAVILPVSDPRDASIDVVSLAGGTRVAVVKVRGSREEAAAVVTARAGRPLVPWSGDLTLRGDVGERAAEVIEWTDRTDDGAPDIVVGRIREGTEICGQERTVLSPRALDPRSLDLRPVTLRRLPLLSPQEELAVVAQSESPGPESAPLIAPFVFASASSALGADADPLLVPAPRALGDGDARTTWSEGVGGEGKWDFVTARAADARWPIRAIALVLPPADRRTNVAPPRRLWIVGDRGPRLHVQVPDSAGGGERKLWIVPSSPLAWRCFSLVLDEAQRPRGMAASSVRTTLADVLVYTDADFGEGVARALERLEANEDDVEAPLALLRALGPAGLPSIAEAWDTLPPRARRRLVAIVAQSAQSDPRARALLLRAVHDADRDVRRFGTARLVEAGASALDVLGPLAKEATRSGDAAAMALARVTPPAVTSLLEAFAASGGSERVMLRRALRIAIERSSDQPSSHELGAWAESSPDPSAAAAVALTLARGSMETSAAVRLVRGAMMRSERFEDQWRLIRAAERLPRDAAIEQWLKRTVERSPVWMLRAQALIALRARGEPSAMAVASDALDDPYPRVRFAALRTVGSSPAASSRVARLARHDKWPLVRRAADALVRARRAGGNN